MATRRLRREAYMPNECTIAVVSRIRAIALIAIVSGGIESEPG